MRRDLDYDGVFARTIRGKPVVLGYYFNHQAEKGGGLARGRLPPPVLDDKVFSGLNTCFVRMTGYGANLDELQNCALSAGHFNLLVDPDGVTRRLHMLIEYRGAYYESLSLAIVRALFGNPRVVPVSPRAERKNSDYKMIESLRIADLTIPVDEHGAALIPYIGPQGSFPYLSAADVLHDRIKGDILEGAIVLVGTTSPGLMDVRTAPVSEVYPGVEAHANMVAGILEQKIKLKPAYVQGAELLTLIIAGLVLSLSLPFLTPLKSACLSLFIFTCVAGIVMWAWRGNMVLPLASSALMIPFITVLNMSYGFFIEARAKRQITGLFGQYVPPDLVAEMSKNPANFSMEGESRELTVLFSDICGFTRISEGLEPKELSKLMNEYLSAMTSVIQKHRGTIDKYIGDAVMAFWGAPLNDTGHARNGVLAALEMQRTLATMRPRLVERGWPEIHIGIGLNTGVMRVGNMGSRFRTAYTVMGDAVNLGSRLEGLTRKYNVGIIVGEETRRAIGDMAFCELDLVQVKGKNQPVAIYEPVGLLVELDEARLEEIARFERALRHYRAREWDQAEELLRGLNNNSPESALYGTYLDRIADFRVSSPGEEWDGVYHFTTK
jgi:adenylate cyclase